MIKKTLLICVICLYFQSLPAISQNFELYNNQNMPSSYNRIADCTDYPTVSRIERNVLGRTFQYENIYQRVNRLEGKILGTNFPHEALCDRINRIVKAASSGEIYAYNNLNTGNILNQTSSGYSWKDFANSFSDNNSYDNQYYNTSQSSSKLQQILDIAIPFITGLAGNNYGSNNYYSGPGYQQEINEYQNLNFGAGVRILPQTN